MRTGVVGNMGTMDMVVASRAFSEPVNRLLSVEPRIFFKGINLGVVYGSDSCGERDVGVFTLVLEGLSLRCWRDTEDPPQFTEFSRALMRVVFEDVHGEEYADSYDVLLTAFRSVTRCFDRYVAYKMDLSKFEGRLPRVLGGELSSNLKGGGFLKVFLRFPKPRSGYITDQK